MSSFSESHVSQQNQGVVIGKLMSTPAGSAANCYIQGVTVSVRIMAGVVVVKNDSVILVKHNQSWFVFGKVDAPPTLPPVPDVDTPDPPPETQPPPPPKPVVRTGTLICAPIQTCTWRDGKWRTDVPGGTSAGDTLQGAYAGYGNNTGCAFYGSKPRSLNGATVTRAVIRVRRDRAGVFSAVTTTLRLVTQSTRPGGAPSLTSSTSGPRLPVGGYDNSFDIPTSWAQAIVNGSAGGLAIYSGSSPYVRLAGRSSWGPAWTMTIYWRK